VWEVNTTSCWENFTLVQAGSQTVVEEPAWSMQNDLEGLSEKKGGGGSFTSIILI
jgi:hypothetical protein